MPKNNNKPIASLGSLQNSAFDSSHASRDITAKQLIFNLAHCDPEVQLDVIKRCSDWIESGGEFNDPYIVRLLQFTFRMRKV